MADLAKIVEDLSNLTVLEAAELKLKKSRRSLKTPAPRSKSSKLQSRPRTHFLTVNA
jgi:hypothetical protein